MKYFVDGLLTYEKKLIILISILMLNLNCCPVNILSRFLNAEGMVVG